MKSLFVVLFALFLNTGAHAAAIKIDDDVTIDVINTLARNSKGFGNLMKHGNRITDITVDAPSGELTNFYVTVRACRVPHGGCLGGATLHIARLRHNSLPPHYTYEATITKLR